MTCSTNILLCGLGNIGSHLAPLLARHPSVERLIIADPDRVSQSNLHSQNVNIDDLEKPKVEVHAAAMKRLRPSLWVRAVEGELEDLPLGCFAGIVLLALDSNGPRQVAAERTWQMGGLLIDHGVNPTAGLARVTVHAGGAGHACLECNWPGETYAALRARHGCAAAPPTNAPAALGAAAAAHGALRLFPLMNGHADAPDDAEWVIHPASGECYRTKLSPNPQCRFDHARLDVELLPGFDPAATLADLFDLLGVESLRIPAFSWELRLACRNCARETETLRVARGAHAGRCQSCGGQLDPLAFHRSVELRRADLTAGQLARPLADIGLHAGDVVQSGAAPRRTVQLGNPFHPQPTPTAQP